MVFTQDGNSTHELEAQRPCHHVESFWQWVGSWAIAARKLLMTSDMPMPGLRPTRTEHQLTMIVDLRMHRNRSNGKLFRLSVGICSDMRRIKREQPGRQGLPNALIVVNGSDEILGLIWCELNDESVCALASAIPDAVEVRGSDSIL